MSIKRTLIKNSSYNLIGYVYLAVASLISIPIVLRNLGVDLYGTYILFSGIILLSATFDLGISQATIRWLSLPDASKKEKTKTWQTSIFFFYTLAILLAIFNFFIFTFFLRKLPGFVTLSDQDYLFASLVASAIVFVNHLNIAFLAIPQAYQRFDIYNTRTVIVGTANTLFTAWLATRYPSLSVLLSFQFFFHCFALITLVSYARKEFGFNPLMAKYQKSTAIQLLGFGYKNFITNITNQIRVQFSNFALGGLIGPTAVTAFSIPQNLIIKAAGGISQITLAFFPLSTSLIAKDRFHKLKRLVIQLQIIILLLGIAQIFFVYQFGLQLLNIWLDNPEVATLAFPVLKVLSWFFMLTTLTPIPTAVFESLNQPQIPALTAFLNTVITIPLIFYLHNKFDFQNAALIPAYANLASSILLVPLLLYLLYRAMSRHQQAIEKH